MKIAVSTYGKDLDAMINPRFGRSEYILIVDTEDKSVEAVPNSNSDLSGGAGVRTAELVISKGAQTLITGSCGPNAMDVFNASGMHVFTGQSGTAGQAVDRLIQGELREGKDIDAKTAAPYPGTGSGQGGCRAMGGQGRGLGRGRGRGRGLNRR